MKQDHNVIHERDPRDGMTPLILASIKGQRNIVKMLLDAEASVDSEDDVGWTGTAAFYPIGSKLCSIALCCLLQSTTGS